MTAAEAVDSLRIVMIDDSPIDARLVEKYLDDLNEWTVEFEHAGNEDDGLQVIEEDDFDVVLLDYALVQTTGVKTAERIRERGHKVPIVMLTGHGDESVATELIHAGGDDYLTKADLGTETLKQSLEYVLQEEQGERKWKERASEWRQVAETDELTHLKSRRALINVLQESLKQAVQNDKTISLAMLDLDNFKQINDSYGHLVGDQVLGETGDIILEHLDENDAAGRYGGDEIAIVFQGESVQGVDEKCESIRDDIANLGMDSLNETFDLDCSIGISKFHGDDNDDHDEEDVYELIDSADQALYRAKRQGPGSIEKRTYSRDRIDPIPVEIRWKDESAMGWIIEHSQEGIRVSSEEEFQASQPVVITLDQPNRLASESEFKGVVRWCRSPSQRDSYQIGIKTRIPRGIIASRERELRQSE